MRVLPFILGSPGQATPALADFQAFNALLAPGRKLDMMLFIQDPVSEPVFYAAYPTWAAALGCEIMSTLAPSITLSSMGSGSFDSTGLYNNTGLNGLAAQCVSYGKPMLIRLCHEFNGNWNAYGYTQETAAQFVAGWQHVVTLFRAQGASNVSWCWCPNVWGLAGIPQGTDIDPTIADSSMVNWYPGDSYVDYVALDGYMSNDSPQLYTPSNLFTGNFASIAGITPKPCGIGEVGCAEDGRLSSVGGKAGWYRLLFTLAASVPGLCFMTNFEQVITPPATNAGDYTINSSGNDPVAGAAFAAGAAAYPFAAQPAGRLLARAGGY